MCSLISPLPIEPLLRIHTDLMEPVGPGAQSLPQGCKHRIPSSIHSSPFPEKLFFCWPHSSRLTHTHTPPTKPNTEPIHAKKWQQSTFHRKLILPDCSHSCLKKTLLKEKGKKKEEGRKRQNKIKVTKKVVELSVFFYKRQIVYWFSPSTCNLFGNSHNTSRLGERSGKAQFWPLTNFRAQWAPTCLGERPKADFKAWPRTWPRGTTQTSLPTVTRRAHGQHREQPQHPQAEDDSGWRCLTGSCALGGGFLMNFLGPPGHWPTGPSKKQDSPVPAVDNDLPQLAPWGWTDPTISASPSSHHPKETNCCTWS